MAKTAQPRVRVALDVLEPSPPNLELPSFDHRTLSLTYPIPSEWLLHNRVAIRCAATSIDAAQLTLRDDANSTVTRVDDVNTPDINGIRYYESIQVQLAGTGTVAAIDIQVSVLIRDTAGNLQSYLVDKREVANPGMYFGGPVLVLPGEILQVATATNGGTGDTALFKVQGHQQEVGMPIVMTPPYQVREF